VPPELAHVLHTVEVVIDSGKLKVCARTKDDFQPVRYVDEFSWTLRVSQSNQIKIKFEVWLADFPRAWSHYGGPSTSMDFVRQLQRIHQKWNTRLSFGLNQTVVIFDAGAYHSLEALNLLREEYVSADEVNNSHEVQLLNIGAVLGWNRLGPDGNRKCADFFDALGANASQKSRNLAKFGHGTAIFHLLAGRSQFSDTPLDSPLGLSIGAAFNARVIMARGFVNEHCAPDDDIPGQTYEDIAHALKATMQYIISNHIELSITHMHISAIESRKRADTDYEMLNNIISPELQKLHHLGISVVAPAGNNCDGSHIDISWPASHPLITSAGVLFPGAWEQVGSTCISPSVDFFIRSSVHTSSAAAYLSAYFIILREAFTTQVHSSKSLRATDFPRRISDVLSKTALTGRILGSSQAANIEAKVVQLDAALTQVLGKTSAPPEAITS